MTAVKSAVEAKQSGSPGQPSGTTAVRRRVEIPIGEGGMRGIFISFDDLPDGREHFAVALGRIDPDQPPLVRLHSECMTGDVFGSHRCDCGPQLREALYRLHTEGGYLLYLRQEGRGIGLYAKFDAYHLQSQGLDTYEANRHLNYPDDMRSYDSAAAMLKALDVPAVRLLTNNPDKAAQLQAHGIEVVKRVPTGLYVTAHNRRYLEAKVRRTRHSLVGLGDSQA